MRFSEQLTALYNQKPAIYTDSHKELFADFMSALNQGRIRSAECKDHEWKVNEWVKMGILIGFRMGVLSEMPLSEHKAYFDKDTFPEKQFTLNDAVRVVPGGTSARNGCYIASGVAIMPPAFINVGSYVDSGTLVDSHALVGSCAQIGKNVHLSAAVQIGGVLEPIGSRPVIIEDEAFIGGNSGIYEGVIVKTKAVIAPGTIITASTPVFDAVKGIYLEKNPGLAVTIPEKAVVVPGSRPLRGYSGFGIYCPIIIKYRDEKTDTSVVLEQDLRDVLD
jgi:2,3,4,5-tetrahydropyridine-2-carboxylate N-succinyltransferase